MMIFMAAPPGRCDPTPVEERVRDFDALVQQPSWIVLQIENNALQPCTQVFANLLHGPPDGACGPIAERGDPDVPDVSRGSPRYPLDSDDRPRDRQIEGFAVRAPNRQDDIRIDRAAHLPHGPGEVQPSHGLLVNVRDQIAW